MTDSSSEVPRPRAALYVVAVSHLDTQWRWTIEDTIREHLPRTLDENFARFERFPHYVVSFDGAFRYRLIEEYWPERMPELEHWIRQGRWAIAGAWLDAADVNLPSPESLVRQALYGVRWFQKRFGVRPRDLFLPDCFGFGQALPSIARHCGIGGFSSQKLSKGRSAVPVPFSLGRWIGGDGASLLASLEPGGYGERLTANLAFDLPAREAVDRLGRACGVYLGQRYFGIGDTGGAPDEESLVWLERSVHSSAVARAGEEALEIRTGGPGRVFDDLTAEDRERLPSYQGELLLNLHASGCYTSQAAMKRWNRRNQSLAAAAEAACVAADWLGALPYPGADFAAAWESFLVHQFHDDLTGTSVPAAYRFSWSDEILALNRFARLLEAGVGGVCRSLSTEGQGMALVVFNASPVDRTDAVVAEIALPPGPAPAGFRALGPEGDEAPVQTLAPEARSGSAVAPNTARVVFAARVPGMSFSVFNLSPVTRRAIAGAVAGAGTGAGDPAVSRALREPGSGAVVLANGLLRVTIDVTGRIAQIEELAAPGAWLDSPVEVEALPNTSTRFPSWEIRAEDVAAAPIARAGQAVAIEIVEDGPVRSSVRVERRIGTSRLVEWIRLVAGCDTVEVEMEVDWTSRRRLLKLRVAAAFPTEPTTAAVYDLGLGVIERGVNSPDLWEVPAQRYAALVDRTSDRALQVLCDSRHGWDRPAFSTLRLTLLHTPGVGHRFRHQGRQDLGHHRLRWGIRVARRADPGSLDRAAARFEQPLSAFQAPPHAGILGRELRFLRTPENTTLLALKGAEPGSASEGTGPVIVRLAESGGRDTEGILRFSAAILQARELNGVEEAISEPEAGPLAPTTEGSLVARWRPFAPRTFALRLAPPPEGARQKPPRSRNIALPRGEPAATWNVDRAAADFDGAGRSYPAELLGEWLEVDGIPFDLTGRLALAARNQVVQLPSGWRALHLLVAAALPPDDEDRERRGVAGLEARLVLGGRPQSVRVPSWSGFAGAWDGAIETTPVAWVGTHRHGRGGDEPYRFCYLWRLVIELGASARDLRLPEEPRLRLFAATVTDDPNGAIRRVGPLYD